MRAPTGTARDGENRREKIRRDPERIVNRGGIEIDVRVQIFLFLHQLCDSLRHPDPFRVAELLTQLYRHALQMRRARVERFVNAMADAHDFFLLLELPLHVGVDFVLAPDFLQHVDHALVRAAVQRTFQGANGRGDGGVKIAQRGDGDAGTESGGVHAMVGVQDKGNIKRVARFLRLRLAIDQIKEMLRFGQVVAHRRQGFALARAMKIRRDDADLGRDTARPAFVDLARGLLLHLGIVETEHGNGGAHDIHRVRRLGRALDEIDHGQRQLTFLTQLVGKFIQLGAVRQVSAPEEKHNFLVADFASQFVDVVAAVDELALVANHVA